MEPADQYYCDRNAGVNDPSGNIWWIATPIEDALGWGGNTKRRASEKHGK